MSQKEKLIKKLLSRPKDFNYSELVSVLSYLGYVEMKGGKTAGSKRSFFNNSTKHIIRLHKPHPAEILKIYQVDLIIEELRKEGLL